jgi:SH3 domain protein
LGRCFFLSLIILTLLGPNLLWAAEGRKIYVSDTLYVGVRRGPSMESGAVDNIHTGQTLILLDESGDKQWVKVQTPSAKVGWVMRRYLMDKPPISSYLQTSQIDADSDNIADVLNKLNEQNQLGQEALRESEDKRRILEKRLQTTNADCASAIALRQERDSFEAKLAEQEKFLQEIKLENESLGFSNNLQWFLAGGAVMLLGWLLGWLFGRRRSSWSSRLR